MGTFRSIKILDRTLFLMGLITIGINISVYLYERNLIPQNEFSQYDFTRKIVLSLMAIPCFGLMFDPKRLFWQYIYGVFGYLYMIQGDWYRPDYIHSYAHYLFGQAIFFNLTRRSFLLIHIPGSLIFLYFQSIHFEMNISRKLESFNYFDYVTIVLIYLLIAYFIFSRFNLMRVEREKNQTKALLLGQQAMNIIHDLKTLSASPQIYLESLQSQNLNSSTKVLLENLKEDLNRMTYRTRSFYQIIRPIDGNQQEEITVILSSVKKLMGHRLNNVKVNIEIKESFLLQRGFAELIFLNLFYNSLEAWQKYSKKVDPTIQISIEGGKILYLDNAGGIQDGKLKKYENGLFSNGLGMSLMADAAKAAGFHLSMRNRVWEKGVGLETEILGQN